MKMILSLILLTAGLSAHATNFFRSMSGGAPYRAFLSTDSIFRCYAIDAEGKPSGESVPDSRCYTGKYTYGTGEDDKIYCFPADANGTPFGEAVRADRCDINPYQSSAAQK